MTMNTKRCTGCGQVKRLELFYLRKAEDPTGPRRARCNSCESEAARARYLDGPSVTAELIERGSSDPAILSPKARDAIFTDKPIDPDLLASYRARAKSQAEREKRAQRRRMREACSKSSFKIGTF